MKLLLPTNQPINEPSLANRLHYQKRLWLEVLLLLQRMTLCIKAKTIIENDFASISPTTAAATSTPTKPYSHNTEIGLYFVLSVDSYKTK
mmetsp:Transcript_11399/g.24166  ORF Transcript_11399/g.24166 Transcript_11399/m.24166 type:complete len:90 (+) Transcript_11399:614-883(+)